MDWPLEPLESQHRFVPRFCPWRDCPQHQRRADSALPFRRHGSYRGHGGRRVPRYRCLTCRRTLSKQTFACSYYLKRPELLVPVAAGLSAGSAHRQLARSLGCAPSTVTRLSARLGRHGLLLQAHALSHLDALEEAVIADHLGSFEGSQDDPCSPGTVTGTRSWFVYALDAALHRRGGRRTAAQQARLDRRPPRPLRGGHDASFGRLLDVIEPLAPGHASVVVISDAHPGYRSQLRRRPRPRVRHRILPNPRRGPKGTPRSRQARQRDAAMFPNDLLHLILRHSLAHLRRETIAFPRRVNALMERMFLAAVWRNFVKHRSERRSCPVTPAMSLGLADRPWNWPRVLARRLFPGRERVPPTWMEFYRREWVTPTLPHNTQHRLLRAF